jgi:hypothetical protein
MKRVYIVMMAALLLASCAQDRDEGDDERKGRVTEITPAGEALSEELMLALSLAKNHHHKADVYLKLARVDDAVAAVKSILDIEFPKGAPEGEDVALDARARLARLQVEQGKLDEAMSTADAGIKGAKRRSFFLANLHAVRAEVLEARAVTIEDDDPAAARQLRLDSIAERDRSIQIEMELLDQRYRERSR